MRYECEEGDLWLRVVARDSLRPLVRTVVRTPDFRGGEVRPSRSGMSSARRNRVKSARDVVRKLGMRAQKATREATVLLGRNGQSGRGIGVDSSVLLYLGARPFTVVRLAGVRFVGAEPIKRQSSAPGPVTAYR
jgi:hypothetical protein